MKEKVFNECLKRMEILGLSKDCINAFKNGEVWLSELMGELYELDDYEKRLVRKFENEHKDYKVYHLIRNIFEFGEVFSIFYVSTFEEEWEEDKEDLQNGYALVYCKNATDEYCSEFGSIAFKNITGGLVRVG